MTIRVGIFFGGSSREREVSFAGGRTVYDNLDKSLFEPVPVFVDSFGQFILLDWQYVYKGSIRDFYPPVEFVPYSEKGFQIYAESLAPDAGLKKRMAGSVGRLLQPDELKDLMDFAFLALHGTDGEDGTIQGLLEWLGIPYSGSGVFGSALGISKKLQKSIYSKAGFRSNRFSLIERRDWDSGASRRKELFEQAVANVGFPMVIKAANQGSTIGLGLVEENDFSQFENAVERSFFRTVQTAESWQLLSDYDRTESVRTIADLRDGLGLPLLCNGNLITMPEQLLNEMNRISAEGKDIRLEALAGETDVLVESFIEGREFSCIVIRDDSGHPVALPPTEIRKSRKLFDYRAKYLPGLSHKVTPIETDSNTLHKIRHACEELYSFSHFNVYARIDGFLGNDGHVYLNDPNTTSGMMPSSFFFHQAAEIGLNPSQFITFIIRNSLAERSENGVNNRGAGELLARVDSLISASRGASSGKRPVAVIMGGWSFERHISMESGRNVFEKLSSSYDYRPVAVFLTGSAQDIRLHLLPVNIMLKDNADDIKHKVENFHPNTDIETIIGECRAILDKYGSPDAVLHPREISFDELAGMAEGAFIALHGRPGEDGTIQKLLAERGMYFNGSGTESSMITINKYETNRILREAGFLTAENFLVQQGDWDARSAEILEMVKNRMGYPLIAKPVDDGCSAAVKKIKTPEQLEAFARTMFRTTEEIPAADAQILAHHPKEEFPRKPFFLIEKFIDRAGARIFLEITGGMLTRKSGSNSRDYEIFPPSETLAEKEILSLEEKFLAGQGQNITPARFSADPAENARILAEVQKTLEGAARVLNVEGYCRIDAFVRVNHDNSVEVIFIEVNSLPGMTPATCIFHQAALHRYKPMEFIDLILKYGKDRSNSLSMA